MFCSAELDPGRPVLIAGPTASGKSALALRIAREQGGIIINADALQVFANWRILTARPDPQDEAAAPHRLFGHVPGEAPYSVGQWLRDLRRVLRAEPAERPIIVGGTGLYFHALSNGLAEVPETPPHIREEADARLASEGLAPLLTELSREDPETAVRIDRQNPRRVQRAWEVLRATGRGLAHWQAETPAPLLPLARTQAFVLHAPKTWLTPRIEGRFAAMMAEGALEEARKNLDHWRAGRPSARAIGAEELFGLLEGRISREEAVARAQIATRQYAKRQRSWFRARMGDWRWIEAAEIS